MTNETIIAAEPPETLRLPAPDQVAQTGDGSRPHQEALDAHAEDYSEAGFWRKVSGAARKAGKRVLNPAFRMYFAAQDPDTPLWARTTIYGALGYFISPIDGLPDFTPLLGYTDDLTLMAGAVAIVAAHIKPEHSARAETTLKRWFY